MVAIVAADRAIELEAANLGLGEAFLDQCFPRNVQFFLAMATQFACQALGDDQVDRGGNVEGWDAHVAQAGQGLRGAVGVQGRQHHVTGLGGLDSDFGGFQVANLTDHDYVRVLAQEGTQGLGEVHALLGIDVDLVDAFEVDLNRVFGGGDIDIHGVEDIQASIERYRLARTGRACHQDHTLRLLQGCHV
ncbi:hypothetical protein D9M68_781390 [compost metagenome]